MEYIFCNKDKEIALLRLDKERKLWQQKRIG